MAVEERLQQTAAARGLKLKLEEEDERARRVAVKRSKAEVPSVTVNAQRLPCSAV